MNALAATIASRRSWWRFIMAFLVVHSAVVLEGWFLQHVGLALDIVVIAVFAVAIRLEEVPGLAFGAVAGLLVDVARGGLLGPSVMALGMVGYVSAAATRWFFQIEGLLSIVLVAVLSFGATVIEGFVQQAFLDYPFFDQWLGWTVLRALSTAAAWVPGALFWRSESRR